MKLERVAYLAAFALAAVVFYRCDSSRRESIGALNHAAAELRRDSIALARVNDSLDARLRADTPKVAAAVTRWRTLIDSFRDTLWDTLPPPPAETIIVRAQEAITACTQALGTCSDLVRAKDRIIANRDSALRIEMARRPSFGDKLRTWATVAGITLLVNAAVSR